MDNLYYKRQIKMKKQIIRIKLVLVIFSFAVISLIVYRSDHQNNSLEPSMNDLSKPIKMYGLTVHENDPLIIEYIQKHYLYPPSKGNYQNIQPKSNPSLLTNALMSIFNGKRNGIFVEAGAGDGEMYSNTIDFEKYYNWTGLLIEPNPLLTEIVLNKQRKSWFCNVCISPVLFPQKVNMLQNINGINDTQSWYVAIAVDQIGSNKQVLDDIPWFNLLPSKNMSNCFPIFSIFSAIRFFEIDFFSLDIEGLELKIIKTIPFDKLNIKVFLVEVSRIVEGSQALTTFMKSKGYYTPPINVGPINLIFIKNGYTAGNIK